MHAPEFVSLADLLRRAPGAPVADVCERTDDEGSDADEVAPVSDRRDVTARPQPERSCDVQFDLAGDVRGAASDARLFRARLADAFADALGRLLRELAGEVLVRELRLAPCDLVALVERVAHRAPFVRLRVATADAAREYRVPALADATLEPGDAVLELAGGALDLRLGVRLAGVLEELA